MAIKVTGKIWQCNNQCNSNCCSEVWLKINPEQRYSLEKQGYFIAEPDLSEWRWVEFHKKLNIEKLAKGKRKISVRNDDYKIRWNEYLNTDMVYVKDKCIQLLPDNRCRVYRNRPMVCKIGECAVFSIKKKIQWYGENGLLKDKIEAYRKGELSKWD